MTVFNPVSVVPQVITIPTAYTTPINGYLFASGASPQQMPDRECKLVRFMTPSANTGAIYIGGSGMGLPGGSASNTSGGLPIPKGTDIGWMTVPGNMNVLWYIGETDGDGLAYMGWE